MITIIIVTLAAGCLLISARAGGEAGQRPWQPDSALRVITELMTLNHQYPTPRGTEIKWLVQGLGAAAAALAAAYAWTIRTRREEDDWPTPDSPRVSESPGGLRASLSAMAPASAAQIALVLFTLWMMLSALWSFWPQASLGEGVRQAIGTVWAIAIARTLSVRGARFAAAGLVGVLAVTAMLGVWYYFERSPDQRLKFPIGNPIFLAACLIPGITVALAVCAGGLDGLRRRRPPPPPPGTGRHAEGPTPIPLWVILPGSAVALLAMLWAFHLTDSRGPALGLLVGIITGVFMVLGRRGRRLTAVVLLIGLVAIVSLRLWPMSWIEQRPDTIRFRLYAWQYAVEIFRERPDIGRGQGAYVLRSQAMSLPDAEQDPPAFQGSVRGHAHNEWLEILADLGAIGFALILTVIGLTLWSAGVALSRAPPSSWERWILIGLVAGFVGIVVTETTDVALRLPGLPLIFYTVLGLLWAASDRMTSGRKPVPRHDRLVRASRFAAVAVLAAGIAWYTNQDWRAALAEHTVSVHGQRLAWDRALETAERAGRNRLAVEGFVDGNAEFVRTAHHAAGDTLEQLVATAARGSLTPHLRNLIIEDAQRFQVYAQRGITEGELLWMRMPYYPHVAGYIAEILMMAQRFERILAEWGLHDSPRSYEEQIHYWLTREHERDRLDARAALELLEFSSHRPLPELIDLVRRPLRRGPFHVELERAVAALMRHPAFSDVMNRMLPAALDASAQADPSAWEDEYAPEILRLAARAHSLNQRFEDAASFAADAAAMLDALRDRFPTTASYARLDQARYLHFASPEHPSAAIEAAREALTTWPPGRFHEPERAGVVRSLALYLLADGREDEARQVLREATPDASLEVMDRQIAAILNELCRRFASFAPEHRPTAFEPWLDRALTLAPDAMPIQETALILALREGGEEDARQRLEAIEALTPDPARFAAMLDALTSQFPDHPVLTAFIEVWESREPPEPPTAPEDPLPEIPGLQDFLPEMDDELLPPRD